MSSINNCSREADQMTASKQAHNITTSTGPTVSSSGTWCPVSTSPEEKRILRSRWQFGSELSTSKGERGIIHDAMKMHSAMMCRSHTPASAPWVEGGGNTFLTHYSVLAVHNFIPVWADTDRIPAIYLEGKWESVDDLVAEIQDDAQCNEDIQKYLTYVEFREFLPVFARKRRVVPATRREPRPPAVGSMPSPSTMQYYQRVGERAYNRPSSINGMEAVCGIRTTDTEPPFDPHLTPISTSSNVYGLF
ncbi:hypothetical protein B0H66DRAFT_526241 [Apodospora peruviana]|uniref:Uncharacterized protein n=1 Tax=Apodospora peruviana TaxID=516989 RepID=A0AAE0IQ18_9PEZI|nr:hypothetical protein B0H66DRAFT_526241 [Apodospora peruviana]